MKVGMITGKESLELIDVAPSEPGPGAIRVDIDLCGICGTEVASYRSGVVHSPSVCGHEWVGRVSAVGGDVSTRTVGQRVVIGVRDACGTCSECRAGVADQCRVANAMARGKDPLAPSHGGFASSIVVAADRVLPAHPDLSDEQAAMVEPTTVALHGIRRSGITLGDVVVVQGAGPIGLLTAQCARAAGAARVVIVEPSDERRSVALEVGIDEAIPPHEARQAVLDLTDGRGADVVVESAGVPSLLQVAIDMVRRGGNLMLLSYIAGETPVNAARIMANEVTIRSAVAFTRSDFEASMALIADGRVRVGPLHTRTIGLSELPGAMAALGAGTNSDIKILVDPRR